MPAPELGVAIVGGGASGLATAAVLARGGVDAVVLDADSQVGGTWARRYDRLCLHTARAFSGLPYLGLPREYPRYVPKDLYARYLGEYAARLGLDVRLGQEVERIAPTAEGWSLTTTSGTWTARVVVVATGRHRQPSLPDWARSRGFAGRLLHSSDYRNGRATSGLRVLVAGLGNSGAEIAADLVDHGAAHVAVSIRRPPPIAARELAGVPLQLLGIVLAPLPAGPVDAVGALLRRIGTRDLRRHGLSPEAWRAFAEGRPPVIDAGFLGHVRSGAIAVRPNVRRLTRRGVAFIDGTEERFDVVVAATGFRTGLERIVRPAWLVDRAGCVPANGAGRRTGLFFVGFRESPRGQLYEAKREAFAVAPAISRRLAGAGR
jgi:cation diffusion facilitator CzcD-associated flavoprotein CzcO